MLSELRMLGAELPIGASANGNICPSCRGGRSSERSLSVTRVDALRLAYCCHRASCGAHGFIGGTPGSDTSVEIPESGNRRPRLYTAETRGLAEDWLHELGDKYLLSKDEINWLEWTEEVGSGRLVVYVREADGKRRGVHTRTRKGQSGSSETRDYREQSDIWMGWFSIPGGAQSGHNQSPIVLVEDVLSAAKVATAGFRSASLMGCNLSLDQFLEAVEVAKGAPIVVALDRDATEKALGFVHRYHFLARGGTLVPLLLSKDLKYHSKEEIQSMVRDVTS